MPKVEHYDGVIIGAGHNAMILEAYMAKAGLKVVALEKQVEVGGGLDTHEDDHNPGFYHNKHSVFHRVVTQLPWYHDLELEAIGLEYITPEVGCAQMYSDGTAICWYTDHERTYQSIARISKKDAETYRELYHKWRRIVKEIVTPETYNPPMPFEEKRKLLEQSEVGREYLRVSAKSPWEVVMEHFENERVQAMLIYLGIMRGYEVRARGIGYLIPAQIVTGITPQLCKGSSHQLAHYLEDRVWRWSGEIRERAGVTNIIVQGGEAKGVELWDGTTIMADRFIASSINPQQTFLELVGEEHLEKDFAERVRRFKYSLIGPIFALNLALHAAPHYRNADYDPDVQRGFLQIMGCDTPGDIQLLFDAHDKGDLPEKLYFNGTTPTINDPTQAPPGKHTAFMWPLVPYNFRGNPENWDKYRDEVFDRYLEVWRQFAPNLTEENIISKSSYTPLDIERHLHNMWGGDWMVGEMNSEQCLDKRPLPELSRHRGPIKNLYLCGSSCHPGGNITGAPGYNAAQIIAEDLGVEKWWNPHDVEAMWRSLKD